MSILPPPKSREDLLILQEKRKKIAFKNAKKSKYFKGKLDHIDIERLEESEEWARIPILDKDGLRAIPEDRFLDEFCIAPRQQFAEFWRSGGSTGRPLFYPRTSKDIRYAMEAFRRSYELMNVNSKDIAHNSFPLGIHPAGQMWARAAGLADVGVNWVGAGSGLPSTIQLQLFEMLKPSIWMGMPSYGLHLANLAEAEGIDLASGSVNKILTSAEPLSMAKRSKLARVWGAEVFDSFGMTECSLMGCENDDHNGLVMWTDIAHVEVLDPKSLNPVGEGEEGIMVMTPLWTNNATPFLRWNSGDIVTMWWPEQTGDPYSVFPIVKHAHRTSGFFKVRGININHVEFEDLMFEQNNIVEFKLELIMDGDTDVLALSIEVAKGTNKKDMTDSISKLVKNVFEVTPSVTILKRGSLAVEYEKNIKNSRFYDRRNDSLS